MAASQSKVIQRSQILRAPKFAPVLDQHIPAGEKVLNAADCTLLRFTPSALDGTNAPSGTSGAAVLTDRALYIFRTGLFGGAKYPWKLDLKSQVREVGVEVNERIGSTNVVIEVDQQGADVYWKLQVGDRSAADLWAKVMNDARQELLAADDMVRGAQLNTELEELRRLQEDT